MQQSTALQVSEKIPGSLRPTTSYDTGRYDNSGLVDPVCMKITAGLFTTWLDPEPEYLPRFWTSQVHPEGQPYFAWAGPLRVVTEAHLYRPETLHEIHAWIDYFQDTLFALGRKTSEEIELFLRLEDGGCAYYFVDHSTRTQFWLESFSTDDLGLPAVVSISQLKTVLTELYWMHVEHFPMHVRPMSIATLNEITSIFSHGFCDQMTSRVSTFLYTAQQCKDFVAILKSCGDDMENGHTTWIIARLCSIVAHHRYITHYGQEHARLSRDQSILYDPEQKHRWISILFSHLTFKTSDKYIARLDDAFVDHLVYENHWEQLISDCVQQWRRAGGVAFGGLLLHIPFLALNFQSIALVATSLTLCGMSLASSMLLTHKYEPMQRINATDAMNYLDTIQSPTFKFQFTALAFSLPQALHLWGFLILPINYLLLVPQYLSVGAAIALTSLSLLLMMILYCITSEAVHTALPQTVEFFRRGARNNANESMA
ncbi:hypothetical protein FB45DRAFT_484525 [Roridomyces roridus]|uniref:Uncharacterized protein n=1 Tax=Roridomyces roridus TaxID=1738132 RepID=A0AAD7C0D5_9AGAR|nr:hypothetical protein FB45DRAFT_484525 [Roridomyces roridus]